MNGAASTGRSGERSARASPKAGHAAALSVIAAVAVIARPSVTRSCAEALHDVHMALLRIDHVQLAMPAGGEERAIGFYERLLGINHVPKPPHLAKRGGCWFKDGDLKVHLGVDAAFRPATKAHPAFIVNDVRRVAAEIAAAGHRVTDDEPLEGYDRVYAYDPFGNRLELMQPLAQAAGA